jgi:formaldehyde-activating enzyme involved in methanogenesis
MVVGTEPRLADAEGAVREWLNGLTELVGAGHPLEKGAHLETLRSPMKGSYAVLTRIGGGFAVPPDLLYDRARISATIYGVTKWGAAQGAIAYGNAIAALRGHRTHLHGDVYCVFVSDIVGPTNVSPNVKDPQYTVDADFYLEVEVTGGSRYVPRH